MKTTTTILAVAIATVIVAGAADAKRLGGGKTISAATPVSSSAKPVSIGASMTSASPVAPSATKKVIAGAAVGAAAGVVAGAALAGAAPDNNAQRPGDGSATAAPTLAAGTPGANRIDATEARLRKLDAEAGKPKEVSATPVKTAAERRREKLEADKKAAAEAAAEMKRAKLAREMSCEIKPVMSDAEILHCRDVWR